MRLVYPQANAPCKDCTERHVGCHIECEGYKHFKEEYAKIQYEARRIYDRENGLDAYEIQRNKRIKERKRHS